MTERIRALLDGAVEDVKPRLSEPAPELARRGQAARRRMRALTVATSAAAVVLAATGGAMIVGGGPGPYTSATDPSAVEVVDGEIRVGGLVLPVPAGWQVLRDKQRLDYCDIPDKSILININPIPGGDCDAHNQIGVGTPGDTSEATRRWTTPDAAQKLAQADSRSLPGPGVNELVAPGGAPVWLTDNDLDNITVRRVTFLAFNVDVPWSGVHLGFELNAADVNQILGSIRIEPVSPGPLALPESVNSVYLKNADRPHAKVADPEIVEQVLDRLRNLDRPVGAGELPCGSPKPLLASWVPVGLEMINLVFVDASGIQIGSVAMSRDGDCSFATSAHGGRVWLPEGFTQEVLTLFGKAK